MDVGRDVTMGSYTQYLQRVRGTLSGSENPFSPWGRRTGGGTMEERHKYK